MLNSTDPISPLQSSTIRASLKIIVFNLGVILTQITGKAFDIDAINGAVDYGVPTVINLYSMWLGWRAYKGRMNATHTIEKPAT